MCTNLCPCDIKFSELWTKIPVPTLRAAGRVSSQIFFTPEEASDFEANGEFADVVPLVFELKRFGFKTFSNYQTCYDEVLRPKFRLLKEDGIWKWPIRFEINGELQFAIENEERYECAGACETPLFHVVRNISLGPPTRNCITAIQEDTLADIRPMGVFIMLTGILFCCATFSACCFKFYK